jgi:hypothetical protein
MAENAHDGRERENTPVLTSENRCPSSYTAQTDPVINNNQEGEMENVPN